MRNESFYQDLREPASLASQRDRRIDSRRAPRRNITRRSRHRKEDEGHRGDGGAILGSEAVKQAPHGVRCDCGEHQSNDRNIVQTSQPVRCGGRSHSHVGYRQTKSTPHNPIDASSNASSAKALSRVVLCAGFDNWRSRLPGAPPGRSRPARTQCEPRRRPAYLRFDSLFVQARNRGTHFFDLRRDFEYSSLHR